MTVLGISAFCQNAAAALIRDGEIIAAAEEERFTRKKHDASFPRLAMAYCLQACGERVRKVDIVAFHGRPLRRIGRLMWACARVRPGEVRGLMEEVCAWAERWWCLKDCVREELARIGCEWTGRLCYIRHEDAHLASAFYPSPYLRAAVVVNDGIGEWATSVVAVGDGARVRSVREMRYPHSLGVLYTAFTQYCGFAGHDGEYKLMGLASYGEPRYVDKIMGEVVEVMEDGRFRLNLEYVGLVEGMEMREDAFARLFGEGARREGEEVTQREADLARSVQVVVEEIILRTVRYAKEVSGAEHLCMGGEVAYNCVANGRVVREGPFKGVWIQPAAGDAGGAVGAALFVWHELYGGERAADGVRDKMKWAYLGPEICDEEVERYLQRCGYPARYLTEDEWGEEIAKLLAGGYVVGVAQGRMEFGPRALGNRSILADPRRGDMSALINAKVKYRESFRPFAPSCREERAAEYFEISQPSPYMMIVSRVRPELRRGEERGPREGIAERVQRIRSVIPAVTHVDYSARVHTVTREQNPRFYALLEAWEKATGCGVLVNTSLNVAGEPIVCTVEDAYRCFMKSGLDYLVLGSYLLDKREQPVRPDGASKKG